MLDIGTNLPRRPFRLCNLSSGNCIERCSRILASPLYICLCVSDPLFIDFDEDGARAASCLIESEGLPESDRF